jgi:hypothetical protein
MADWDVVSVEPNGSDWDVVSHEPSGPTRLYSSNSDAPTSYGTAPDTSGPLAADIDPYRVGGQFAQRANDSIADTFGAPVDFVSNRLGDLGVPMKDPVGGSASLKRGIDYVATLPSRLWDTIKQYSVKPLADDRTSRFEPASQAERIAGDLGNAVGTVAGTFAPASVVSKLSAAGSIRQLVADAVKANPAGQAAALSAGNVTGDVTDSPTLGAVTSLGLPMLMHGGQRAISAAHGRENSR